MKMWRNKGIVVWFILKHLGPGAMAASGVLMITLGILVVYVLGSLLQWKVVAWVCLTVPLAMTILVFLIPESPGWLVRKVPVLHIQLPGAQGLYSQADRALEWLRREEEEFAMEVEVELKARIDRVSEAGVAEQGCCSRGKHLLRSIFCRSSLH